MKLRRNEQYEVLHPCIDNINGKLQLKIFRWMFEEPTLPKFNNQESLLTSDDRWAINAVAKAASEYDMENAKKLKSYHEAMRLRAQRIEHPSAFQKIKNFFLKPQDPITTMNNVKQEIALSPETLDDELKVAEDSLEKLLKRAVDASQTKLVDEILKYKRVLAGQMVLKEHGFDRYITERTILNFIKKSRKGVRIDFIRNYEKFIPLSVLEAKKRADELKVFDNYCVLYYDPEWESWGSGNVRYEAEEKAHIAAEEERRIEEKRARIARETQKRRNSYTSDWSKDPILFGMINGSRRLYFVADWVTDDDDLTLEKLNLVCENATQYLEYYTHDMRERHDLCMERIRKLTLELQNDLEPVVSAKD